MTRVLRWSVSDKIYSNLTVRFSRIIVCFTPFLGVDKKASDCKKNTANGIENSRDMEIRTMISMPDSG